MASNWKRLALNILTILSQHLLLLSIYSPLVYVNSQARIFAFVFAWCNDSTYIPNGSKDSSLPTNYHGITLASSLSKVLEWSILLTWGNYFTTSDLKFDYLTTLCTGVMKAIISCYLNSDSRVHACFIDASKAFDMVNHLILFEQLQSRGIPKPLIRLLYSGTSLDQQLCVR